MAVYHGHGIILSAYKIGSNFSVYQGVTVGKNGKAENGRTAPIIGDVVYGNPCVIVPKD